MTAANAINSTRDFAAERFAGESWSDERIAEIETSLLQGVFGCRTPEAVEASITYARFMSSVGITPENFPVFLRMLEIENHWVVDALIGERDPFLLLSPVQPNQFIVGRIFAMMTRWHKGGIYEKNLSVILGVLQSVYSSPREGYRIYPMTIANLNALGKHMNKESGQDDPLNRVILEVLDKISDLEDQDDPEIEEAAIHAAALRQAFFDDRRTLEDVIPPVLLVSTDDRKEISPRRYLSVPAAAKSKLRRVEGRVVTARMPKMVPSSRTAPGQSSRRKSPKKKAARQRRG